MSQSLYLFIRSVIKHTVVVIGHISVANYVQNILLNKYFEFNVHGSMHFNNILVYNPNKMHKLQSLFNLLIAVHVSGVTITHLQEHKTTVSTASGNRYTVIDIVKFTDKGYQ
jgi:hypothetical protein